MSRIRGKNTKPEILMKEILTSSKIKFEFQPKMTGNPDFLIPGYKIVVFIDGCFWHGCPKHFKVPKTNSKFWSIKIGRNKARRVLVNRQLRKAGYVIIRIWEHELSRRKTTNS